MTAYGDNATVQKTVFGVVDSNEDTRCTNARTTATYFMNTELGLLADLASPDNEINNCCNYLAAGIVGSSPENVAENINWKMGIKMLDKLKNRSTAEKSGTGNTLVVDRF